jgi:hypothetical protein
VSPSTGKSLHDYSDPVREGSTATLVCETVGGDPLPRISWWRGKTIVDDVVEEVDAKAREEGIGRQVGGGGKNRKRARKGDGWVIHGSGLSLRG